MLASIIREVKYMLKPVTRLPYPAGVYSADIRYTCSENVAPYVVYQPNPDVDAVRYVMNKPGTWLGTEQGMTPAEDYALNGSKATWIPFTHFNAVEIELALIKFGKIGQAIFYDQYTISEHGKDNNGNATTAYKDFDAADPMNPNNLFRPNICMNWQTGDIHLGRANLYSARFTSVDIVQITSPTKLNLPITSNFVAIDGNWGSDWTNWGNIFVYMPPERDSCTPSWEFMEITILNLSTGPVTLDFGYNADLRVNNIDTVISSIKLSQHRYAHLVFRAFKNMCGLVNGVQTQAGKFYLKNVADFDITVIAPTPDSDIGANKSFLISKDLSYTFIE